MVKTTTTTFEEKKDSSGDYNIMKSYNNHPGSGSSSSNASPHSKPNPKNERLYNKGATELFLHIEQCDWEQAYLSFAKDKKDVGIWVKKTGNGISTHLGYSLWSRLPIHEACRRQPPAWFISNLLSAYPESATLKNDFGQMPLHVAVECGATPEIINLLVLSNWHAIRAQDNSGRTPLQILDEGEETSILEQEDINVVRECLQRSLDAYLQIEISWKKRWDEREMQHLEQIGCLKKKHQQEILVEKNVQGKLKNELDSKKNIIDGLKSDRSQLESMITTKKEKETLALREVAKRDEQIQTLQQAEQSLQGDIQSLQRSVEQKDKTIQKLNKNIQTLSNDLAQITIDHDDQLIITAYGQLEEDMRALRQSQKLMAKQLTKQSKGLHGLLKARGIKLAPQEDETDTKNQKVPTVPEEEEAPPPSAEDEPMDTTEVANNVATAALAALQVAEQEGNDIGDNEDDEW